MAGQQNIGLLQPNLCSREELCRMLILRGITPSTDIQSDHGKLVELAYTHVTPKPQRKYRDNRQGRQMKRSQIIINKRKRKYQEENDTESKSNALHTIASKRMKPSFLDMLEDSPTSVNIVKKSTMRTIVPVRTANTAQRSATQPSPAQRSATQPSRAQVATTQHSTSQPQNTTKKMKSSDDLSHIVINNKYAGKDSEINNTPSTPCGKQTTTAMIKQTSPAIVKQTTPVRVKQTIPTRVKQNNISTPVGDSGTVRAKCAAVNKTSKPVKLRRNRFRLSNSSTSEATSTVVSDNTDTSATPMDTT